MAGCDLLLVRRVASLLVGFLACLVGGVIYSVGVWGKDMRKAAGWDDDELETIKSMLDVGLYACPHLGLLIDWFGAKDMDWAPSLLALGLFAFSYLTLWRAAAKGCVEGTPCDPAVPPALGSFAALVAGWGYFVAFSVQVRANALNFGKARKGTVDGFLAGGFGISAAIVAQVYSHAIGDADHNHVAEFLLVLGCLSMSICFLSAVFTRRLPADEAGEVAAAGEECDVNDGDDDGGGEEDPLAPAVDCRSVGPTEKSISVWPEETPPWRMLFTDTFWRLFLLSGFSGGACVWLVQSADNLTKETDFSKGTFVLLFSVCNMTARWIGGSMSDVANARYAPRNGGRILVAIPSALLMCTAAVIILAARKTTGVLPAAAAIGGTSEGLFFGCWFPTMRDTFGPKHYATNMSVMLASFAAGTTFYLKGLAAISHDSSDQDTKLRPVLIGVIALTLLASLVALSLFVRPRSLFRARAAA